LAKDDRGQMMMLSAVVLLVGFLALTGMVARVNQLGTQTGTEARQAVLDEAGPLQRSIDNGLARLSNRTFTNCCTWTASKITSTTAIFTAADVGLTVKGGSGAGTLPRGTVITAITSSTVASINVTSTLTQGSLTTLNVWRPGFTLKATTTPTAETAAVQMLEQLQLVEAGHGLWMDWQVSCASAAATTANAIATLSDGIVWLQIQSMVAIPVASCADSASCADLTAPATVVACG
jgi:hypothetical protein